MQRTPSLSHRISSLAPSPTVALNAKAKELAAKGIKVINLTVGEPDFATPKVIVDKGVAALQAGKTKYGAAGGGPALRTAIAEKMKRDNNLTFSNKEIVAGIGAKEILFHLALATLNEGDEVLIPAPYWVSYTAHCEAAGAKGVIIPMPEDPQKLKLTPESFAKYATPRTKAVILNSPNNPGGYVLTKEELKSLGDYFVKQNWWIISDEIYEYLSFDHPHVSMLELCPELRDRFILVNGLSKGYAMTGWRVGYACGPVEVIKLVENLQSQSSTCLPQFIEEAATFALGMGRDLLREEIAGLQKRRDMVVKEVAAIPGLNLIKAQGAFYLFIDLRARLAKTTKLAEKTSMAFSAYLLERGEVAMVPGEAFGVPGYIRMSYAADDKSIVEGVRRIGRCLDELT